MSESKSKTTILRWSDIQSETIPTDEYFEFLKKKEELWGNYEAYEPKEDVLKKISEILSDPDKKVKILAIGAEWCHDCAKQLPRMTKIVRELGGAIDFQVLYGLKVDALKKAKGKIKWHEEHSPPEANDPKFDVKAIPTIYIFVEDEYVHRLVEGPERFPTLEEELLNILEKKL